MGGNENYPPNYIIRDEQKHEGHVTVINLQKCRCMNKIAYTYARVEQELLLVTFPKRWRCAPQTLRIQNLRRDQKGKKEKQKNYQKLYLIQRSIAWELCWVGHKKQFFQVWKIPKFRADKNLGFQKKSKKTKEAEQSRAEDWRCFSLERTSDSEVLEQKLCDRFWLTLSDLTLILSFFPSFLNDEFTLLIFLNPNVTFLPLEII